MLWQFLENIIQTNLGCDYKIDPKNAILGFWSFNNSEKPNDMLIINSLLGICSYHIWKIRNCIKHGEENITFSLSVKRLKIDIAYHLTIL